MFRWLLGSRDPHNGVEKSAIVDIGEEQTQNPYTELSVLQGHNDIVRFLLQIDECRFASACDDGSVYIWDVQTGDILCELHGHTQKITAMVVWGASDILHGKTEIILTASADKTVIAWDCDSTQQVQKASDFQSTVKALLVLQSLDVWLSGGNELRVWNRDFNLLCETGYFVDGGISTLIELPKNCAAAAIGKDLMIFKLSVARGESDQWDVSEVRCLSAHQDIIRSLITVSDLIFVSGSHAGELIVWDAVDWTYKAAERNFSEILSPQDAPQEIKLLLSPEEISVQHLTSDDENVFAAVGRGLCVYNLQMKRVIAYQKKAHDSSIQHITKLPNGQLVSCSEDGSVRIWELRAKPLQAESVPAGFFSMWGFGKAAKQSSHAVKKTQDTGIIATLELIGNLIGHSGSVQMFLYFKDHGLVTCSSDHLIIIWKEGHRESRLRSLMLFQKLEQNGDLNSKYSLN